jgi:hypothetical protein
LLPSVLRLVIIDRRACQWCRPKAQGFSKQATQATQEGEALNVDGDARGRKGVNKQKVQVGKKKLMPLETQEWEVRINIDSGSMTPGLLFLLQSEGVQIIKILE